MMPLCIVLHFSPSPWVEGQGGGKRHKTIASLFINLQAGTAALRGAVG